MKNIQNRSQHVEPTVAKKWAASDANTTLDGSTYPTRSKINWFSLLNISSYENASGWIWDQCCHLLANGAL